MTLYGTRRQVRAYTYKGFSLIELMVVIAIVAVLAAVAMPAYQRYLGAQKISTTRTFMDAQAASSKQFYAKNGRFPNVAELGLPADPGYPTSTVFQTDPDNYIVPYMAGFGAGFDDDFVSNGITCPSTSLTVTATNFLNGPYDGDMTGSIYAINYYIMAGSDGIIYQKCLSYGVRYDGVSADPLDYQLSNCPNIMTNADEYQATFDFFASKCN